MFHNGKKHVIPKAIVTAVETAYDNCCAICGRESNPNKALAFDHCHSTGELRGLLCDSCNTGVGCFRDDVALLQKAIDYLKAEPKVAWRPNIAASCEG